IAPPRVLSRHPDDQGARGFVERRPAGVASASAGPLQPDKFAVPTEHGLRRHEESTPRLPREAATGYGEEEPIPPPKPGTADLPAEHLKLVAQDHNLQILGVLLRPYEHGQDSLQDQGHERSYHGALPTSEMPSNPRGLLLGMPIANKCTLQVRFNEPLELA